MKVLLLFIILFNLQLGSVECKINSDSIPSGYYMFPIYLNPYGLVPKCKISIPDSAKVAIYVTKKNSISKISNIFDGILPPGIFEFLWDGKNFNKEKTSPGFYYLIFEARNSKAGVEIYFKGKIKFLKIW